MATIGFVGLGKLGLPVALAIESKGHKVIGYDIDPAVSKHLAERRTPYVEQDLQPLLDRTAIELLPLKDVVLRADIVFVPIQTPHDPRFDGCSKLPVERRDFDYSFLLAGIRDIARVAEQHQKRTILAVISTCLPGTYERLIKPELNDYIEYVYTPQFIAMGTVLADYLDPEFVLVGVESKYASEALQAFYASFLTAPSVVTDITTAEGVKVSYNTWLTAKTVIANIWGELAYHLDMDFDALFKAWSLSTRRILSPRYMRAGMSDGGGCHPRDNIALSYLARRLGLSHDIFDDLMRAREDCERWHGAVAKRVAQATGLPLYILGRAFKPETELEDGSPALLMASMLDFPHQHVTEIAGDGVYFVATGHERYRTGYTEGSVVIDPFGFVEHPRVLRLGRERLPA